VRLETEAVGMRTQLAVVVIERPAPAAGQDGDLHGEIWGVREFVRGCSERRPGV
jgi:hypothetical protein